LAVYDAAYNVATELPETADDDVDTGDDSAAQMELL
jgi:hypothetical protein